NRSNETAAMAVIGPRTTGMSAASQCQARTLGCFDAGASLLLKCIVTLPWKGLPDGDSGSGPE
ncbi:MAG TPA: hypothetical protein VGL95_12390, partial [Acetobacteraceae bacterium]